MIIIIMIVIIVVIIVVIRKTRIVKYEHVAEHRHSVVVCLFDAASTYVSILCEAQC